MKWTNITAVILLAATMLFSASAPAPGNGLNLPPLAQGASGNSEISVVEAMPSVSMCPGYTRFDIGQEMSGNGYTVRLDDLTVAEGNANTHSAVIEIKDSTGNVLEKAKIAPGKNFVYSGASGKVAISVCQVAAGYTLNSKWAKIKISSTNAAATSDCKGYSALEIGQTMAAGSYTARLADISTPSGTDNSHPAIVDILDSNNIVVDSAVLLGQSYTYAGSNGQKFTVSVCQTAPGFTLNAKWAKMKVSAG